MSPACGPSWSTQPKMTSSTTMGSIPVRSTSDVMTCAPRSAGCTCASPPPRLPTGVRTASTMYASGMVTSRLSGALDELVQRVRRVGVRTSLCHTEHRQRLAVGGLGVEEAQLDEQRCLIPVDVLRLDQPVAESDDCDVQQL